MREILFRGKRTDNGKWVFGFLHKMDGYGTGYTEYGIQIQDTSTSRPWSVLVIPETVGQYTGLTDKNGKKIFEGDIFDTPDRLIKVVWLKGNAQFDLDFVRYAHDKIITNFKGIEMRDLCSYEIIGNIHDNPELLKGGERYGGI